MAERRGIELPNKHYKSRASIIFCTILAIITAVLPAPVHGAAANASPAAAADNFECFEDNFNRTDRDINGDNGWISVPRNTDRSHIIEGGELKAEDFKYSASYTGNGACTAVTRRPISERALDQSVSAEIINLGNMTNFATANLHLRVIPTDTKNSAGLINPADSYYLAISRDSIQIRRTEGKTVASYAVSEAATYTYTEGHSYRARLTADGVNPTVLTAYLYDITEDFEIAAQITTEDSTESLQNSGTVGQSCTRNGDIESLGRYYALFDSFKYERKNLAYFNDDFLRSGDLGNNWTAGSKAGGTLTGSAFNIKTVNYTPQSDRNPWVEDSAYTRPMNERALNQQVEIEFGRGADSSAKGDIGAVIAARAQNEILTPDNSYRACAVLGWNGAKNWNGKILVYSGATAIAEDTQGGLDPNGRYRLRLEASSTDTDKTLLNIELFLYNSESGSWIRKYKKEITDGNAELQKPGTVGFSVYDKWRGSLDVYSFKYTALKLTFKYIEAEEAGVFKNFYETAPQAAALDDGCVKSSKNTVPPPETELTSHLNYNTAYIAYAVNAKAAGSYFIRPSFKLSGAPAAAFDGYCAENGEYPYITAVVNGKSYKFACTAPQGILTAAEELPVKLNAGVNIIYFMGITAPVAAKLPGVTVDYNLLYISEGLEIINPEFTVPGDVNSDSTVNIKDLIRLKRFTAEEKINISLKAITALCTDKSDEKIDSGELVIMKKYLLNAGASSTEFNDKTWLTAIKRRSVNALSVITEEHGGADDAAEELKAKILNKADSIATSAGGTKYYISSLNGDDGNDGKSPAGAWKSLERLRASEKDLKAGDAVLFERGSVFRQNNTVYAEHWRNYGISAVSGVSYGAYGAGEKPEFYGSAFNYADCEWKAAGKNIWQTDLPLQDAGVVVFDGGSSVGVKKPALSELTSGNEFFHDTENGVLYLYCREGNPGDIFSDIEIGCDRQLISFRNGVNSVNIENLSIKYVGAHAINGYENNHNINITGCEIAFVGGSFYNSRVVRYGNAVQFWDRCYDISVNNCWVYQIYDAGLTFQGSYGTQYDNISFENNLIQYCNYSIEFFIKDTKGQPDDGALHNIRLNNNICQFAGCGLTRQREEGSVNRAAHIAAWATDVGSNVSNFQIKNNIFDISSFNIIRWIFSSAPAADIQNNSYYMNPDISDYAINYASEGQLTASDQKTLEAAVAVFDACPKSVKWLE